MAGAKKAKEAKKIVKAFEETDEPETGVDSSDDDAAAQQALVRLQRRALVRNVLLVVLVACLAGGGWYAYQTFFAEDPSLVASRSATGDEGSQQLEEDDEVVFLPLAEPIYDIQENILAASTAPTAVSEVSDDAEESVVQSVESLVEKILEDQLRKARAESQAGSQAAATALLQEQAEAETLAEELDSLLDRQIVWDEVEVELSDAASLNRLEDLSRKAYRENGQFIASQRVAAIEADEAAAAAAAEEEEGGAEDTAALDEGEQEAAPAAPQPAPAPLQIARKSSDMGGKLNEGSALYSAGDLTGAELAFRTILALEPRNVQALVGLARIYSARGNDRLAVATLLKASEYSPNNPLVISELIAIQASTSLRVIPTELVHDLLSRTDDKALQSKLLFVLGLNESKKQNWLEAKRIFLDAHNLNPANPDIAFNLAVVHDYLGESASAADLYRTALANAQASPSSFNKQVARDRAETLEN